MGLGFLGWGLEFIVKCMDYQNQLPNRFTSSSIQKKRVNAASRNSKFLVQGVERRV